MAGADGRPATGRADPQKISRTRCVTLRQSALLWNGGERSPATMGPSCAPGSMRGDPHPMRRQRRTPMPERWTPFVRATWWPTVIVPPLSVRLTAAGR